MNHLKQLLQHELRARSQFVQHEAASAARVVSQVTIRAGWQLIGPAEEVAVRAFYTKMKDLAKSFKGPLDQSSLDVALRYNLSHDRRDIVFAKDPNLQLEALDWACKLFS